MNLKFWEYCLALLLYIRLATNTLREDCVHCFIVNFKFICENKNPDSQCASRPRFRRTFSSVHQNTWNGKTAEYFSCYMSIRIDICIQAELTIYFQNITSEARYCFLCHIHRGYRSVNINHNFVVCDPAWDDDN